MSQVHDGHEMSRMTSPSSQENETWKSAQDVIQVQSNVGSEDLNIEGEVVEASKQFNTLSTLSLAVSLMATWEALCSTMGAGLVSGGPVSLVYGFIGSFIGSVATAMSLAEPASMWPSAGGQYQFMAELSSPQLRAIFSWFSGWITVLGWLALTASAPFASGTLIQGLITLNHTDYVRERWHGTLLYVAVISIAFVVNLFASSFLPLIENLIMVLHVLFFSIIFIVVLVVSPTRNSASFVFTEFQNNTGWSSDGIAWSLGLLTSTYIMVGYDSAMHISEEIRNPKIGVPRAMIGSLVMNGTMGFALLIAILFGMGDLKSALDTNTGFPIIQIFYKMTGGNLGATNAMTSTIICSASLATIGLVASASRTLWAFARDGAPPFSTWISRLDDRNHIPANAVICTSVSLVVLGLLNIASTTAFNAILSLTVVALNLSYVLPVIAMLYRRLCTPHTLVYGPWRLPSTVGIIANIVSIVYILYTGVFLLFPTVQPVNSVNMNYAGVVLGAVLLFSAADWFLRAHKTYSGPLVLT